MNLGVRARLELVRFPNLFTAVADVLAGFLYVGGWKGDWPFLLLVATASSCLYGGGAALNDLRDAERDRRDRPERPIPSGRITLREAGTLAVGLLMAGLILAACASARAAALAASLVVAIVLYNGVLKSTWLAPGVMGLCRALNLALGMSVAFVPASLSLLAPLGLIWLYVTSVTFFGRTEAEGGHWTRLSLGTLGVCAAVAGLGSVDRLLPHPHRGFWVGIAVLGVVLAHSGFRAAIDRSPQRTQAAVRVFVLSLVAFDACLTWAARGPFVALAVATCFLPAILFARWFRVT